MIEKGYKGGSYMKMLLTFFLVFYPLFLIADMTATLDDGRKVLLKDNKTWEIIPSQKTNKVITLEKFETKYIPADTDRSRYSDEAEIYLYIKNNTEKPVKAWKAKMTVNNSFKELLFSANVSSGDSNIQPNDVEKATFTWEDNQFIDKEPYDYLTSYSKENLNIQLSDIKIIQ